MFKISAQGFISWAVLNEKLKIVSHSSGKQPNLILDNGLNMIAENTWAECFQWCNIGSGDLEPNTGDIGLQYPLYWTNTYYNENSGCGTSEDTSSVTLKRTFLFSSKGEAVSYGEIGFTNASGANLFSKIKFSSPVEVAVGKSLAVQYELKVYFDPIFDYAISNPISGYSFDGKLRFQFPGIMGIDSTGGNYVYDNANLCNEPSKSGTLFFSTDSSPSANFGSAIDRSASDFSTVNLKNSQYEQGMFYIDKSAILQPFDSTGNWGSLGIGSSIEPYKNTGLVFVGANALAKNVGYLNLFFRYSWGRWPAADSADSVLSLFYHLSDTEMMLRNQNPLLTIFELNNE